MRKNIPYISRQLLIGIMALQFLNMSVCSEAYSDDYDYSCAYNKGYDPTETVVEFVVELKYGQQQAFTYDHHTDTNKNSTRATHWHPYLQPIQMPAPDASIARSRRWEARAEMIPFPSSEIISPPPESLTA